MLPRCFFGLLALLPVRGEELVSYDVLENFVHAMHLADTRGIPCGQLNEVCLSNDLHQAILYMRLRPDDDLLQSRGPLNSGLKTEVQLRLQLLGLRFTIWELLSPSQQLLVGLVLRYAPDTVPDYTRLVAGGEARHTPHTWAQLIISQKPYKELVVSSGWAEERLLYLLALPNDEVTPPVYTSFKVIGTRATCTDLPSWASKLVQEAPPEVEKQVQARLCSYPFKLLESLQEATLEQVLQPLLMTQPVLAFASPLYGALFSALLENLQTEPPLASAFLRFLAAIPPVDHGFSLDELRKQFGVFLTGLQDILSKNDRTADVYDMMCARVLFPNTQAKQKELLALIPLTQRAANPFWCGLTAFGISLLLPHPEILIDRLLSVEPQLPPLEPERDEAYKMTLFKLGRDKSITDLLIDNPTANPMAYNDDQLRLILYRRLPVQLDELASESLPRLMETLARRFTLVDLGKDLSEKEAHYLAARLVACKLEVVDEIRAFFTSFRMERPLMNCAIESKPSQPGRVGSAELLTTIEAFHMLLYELIGVPVSEELGEGKGYYATHPARVLEKKKDLEMGPDHEAEKYQLAAALLVSRSQCTPHPDRWNEELIQHLCKGKGKSETPPLLPSQLSLPLAWHLLLPARMHTCEDYQQLVDLVRGTVNSELMYRKLVQVPLYGPLLEHFGVGKEKLAEMGVNFSREGGQKLISLINDRYEQLARGPKRLALLLPPSLRTGSDEQWIQNTPKLSGFLERCKTPAACLGQWSFYGYPVADYIRLMGHSDINKIINGIPLQLIEQLDVPEEATEEHRTILPALLQTGSGRSYALYEPELVKERANKLR